MPRKPTYSLLFEPVKIGPVTAPNRFYQVPHCTGMGADRPNTLAGMREVKAEGGWGVINTEYCSIHPTSDETPFNHCSLWDEDDLRNMALMTEKVHKHGALAGIELWHGGSHSSNLMTRLPSMSPSGQIAGGPFQSRVMDKFDIKELRRYHVDAARRAMQADYDIIYVYAGHHYILHQFLSPQYNNRTDEYGGNVENRVRIVKEILEEVKETVGHRCAVATRFAVDSGLSDSKTEQDDEAREMVSILAELPDLWDVIIDDYSIEMGPSRFTSEGGMEHFVSYVKQVTSKPVVGVGRFTAPDTMVRMIKKGVLDLIGAARPSIADPFLPNKIKEGREEEIRECIGCNICYAHDDMGAPIRCTQNPTMGEEWRRGWHPEYVPEKSSDEAVLVVGSGPAGLEAAYILGKRGYPVILAEAEKELGGRVTREARLPSLSEVARVRDYRVQRLQQMPNVEIYMDSPLTAEDVLEFAFPRVIIATGAKWRTDGMGRSFPLPLTSYCAKNLFTPDDLMDGKELPTSETVVLFDDDHYYMGAVMAEYLQNLGKKVTYVTSTGRVADWSEHTGEQYQTHQRLISLGIEIIVNHTVSAFDGAKVTLKCIYSDDEKSLDADIFVPVTSRSANNSLYEELNSTPDKLNDAGITQLVRIGDCDAPSIIASAIYAGHHIGRTIDTPESLDVPFKRDRALIQPQ